MKTVGRACRWGQRSPRVKSCLNLASIACARHPSADETRKLVISDRRSVFACCIALRDRGRGACGFRTDIAACMCRIVMECHMTGPVTMQVARSVRIRSRCLAMPTGKARRLKRSCTQRPEATSGSMPIRACCQSAGCPQSLFSRCAQPKRTAA